MPESLHGVDAGDHGKLREAIDALGIVGGHVVAGRPVVHVAAEAHLVQFGVEQADLVNAALT